MKKKKIEMLYELIDINTSFHIKERNNIGRVKPLPSIMRCCLQNMH